MSAFSDALAAFRRSCFDQAIALFTKAIDCGDNVAEAYSKRGVCLIRLGDPKSAESDFRRALFLDARCLSAMINVGNLMLERGCLEEAYAYYQRALCIDQTYGPAHHNLGVLLRQRGDIGGSIRELRLAAKYDAGLHSARKLLDKRRQ
jgi:Flp pilus assembly protein TadD